MLTTWAFLSGIGLVVLWIAGLTGLPASPWVTWIDGAWALCAFLIASTTNDRSTRTVRVTRNIALSIGLFATWIIALATDVVAWQSWWTFAFACSFALLAIATASYSERFPVSRGDIERKNDDDQFRKSA